MNCLAIACSRFNASFDLAWMCGCVSRLLLLLAAVEVITMPLTQHLWTWDKFLHGGQDFELGMLMVVTCLCFVLLRAHHGRQRIGWLLTIGTLLLLIFERRERSRMMESGQLRRAAAEEYPDPPSGLRSLPLRI